MKHVENLEDIVLELKNVRERLGGHCPVIFLSVVDDRDPIFELEPEVNLVTSPYTGEINSWRGVYTELAIGMNPNEHSGVIDYILKIMSNTHLNKDDGVATVDELIELLEDTNGTTFFGCKGGEFVMSGNTKVYLDEYGYVSSPSIKVGFIGSHEFNELDNKKVCVVCCVNENIDFESNAGVLEPITCEYLNEKVESLMLDGKITGRKSDFHGEIIKLPELKDITGINPSLMYYIDIEYAQMVNRVQYITKSHGKISLGNKTLFDTREENEGLTISHPAIREHDVNRDKGRSRAIGLIYDKTVKSLVCVLKNGLLLEKGIEVKKERVLHHLSHIDLDGYGCQYLTTLFRNHDEEVLYYNSNYGGEIKKKLQDIITNILLLKDKEHTVLITDLNLSQSQAQFIDKKSKEYGFKVILLDHHASGENVASLYDWYNLDTTKSSTLLTMDFLEGLRGKKIDDSIVQIINSYDLWREDNELFKYGKSISFVVNYINALFPRSNSVFSKVHDEVTRRLILSLQNEPNFIYDNRFNGGYCYEFGVIGVFDSLRSALEKTCIDLYDEHDIKFDGLDIDGLVEYLYCYCLYPRKTKYTEDNGNISFCLKDSNGNDMRVIVACSPIHISSGAMNLLLRENGLLAVVLCYDSGSVSLRSRGNFDVGMIAKELGGGGHQHAAGCFLSDVISEFNKISPGDRNLKTYFELIKSSKLVKVIENWAIRNHLNSRTSL